MNNKKNAVRILQFADNDAKSFNKKTLHHAHFPLIEKVVYRFVVSARSLKYSDIQAVLTEQALTVRERIYSTAP